MPEKIKTLIIDDTVIYRKIASDVASSFPEIELIGTASNGDLGLKKLEQTKADLVLCDVNMPVMDGLATLTEVHKRFPDTFVVMMSDLSNRNADITIKALEMGALDFIRKPQEKSPEESLANLKTQFAGVIRLVNIRRNTRKFSGAPTAASAKPALTLTGIPLANVPKPVTAPVPRVFSIIAIGVSTGGPEALNKLIPALPANLPLPVVLVQHMPPVFTKSLADSLDKKSQVRVHECEAGTELKPGHVYIAAGGRHMTVTKNGDKKVLAVNDGPPENSCRPAVDVLFRSVADVYGDSGILAAILTGMGSDGLNGIRTMKRKGCYCITQTEKSCVVYGMPRAIDENGLNDISLSIEEIAGEISKKAMQKL